MKRFSSVSYEEERKRLEDSATAISTRKMDFDYWKMFTSFVATKGELDAYMSSDDALGDILCAFFTLVRKPDGEKMKSSSMETMRYSLNRTIHSRYNKNITDKFSFPKCYDTMKNCKHRYLSTASPLHI